MGSDNTNKTDSYVVLDNYVISNNTSNGTSYSYSSEKKFNTNQVDDAIKGLSDAQTLLLGISDNLKKLDIPRQCGFYGDPINVFEEIVNPSYSGKSKIDMSHNLTYIANLIKNYEDGMIDDENNNSSLIRDINVTRMSGNNSSSFDVEVEGDDFSASAALSGIPTGGDASIGAIGSSFVGIDPANLAVASDPVSGGSNAFYKATDSSVGAKPQDGEYVIGQTPAQESKGSFDYSTASYEAPVEEAPVVETPPVTTPPATEPPFTFEDNTNFSDTNTVSQDPFSNGVSNYSSDDGFDNSLAADNSGVNTDYQEESTSDSGNKLKLAGGIALASGLALGSAAAITAAKNNKRLKNGEDDDDSEEAYQYRKFM